MSESAAQAKPALRRSFRSLRAALPAVYRAEMSRRVCGRLRRVLDLPRPVRVGAFHPISDEIDLLPVLREIVACGGAVALPQVQEDFSLRFLYPQQLDDLVVRGRMGIPEPNPETALPADTATLDAVIVPALAWDIDSYRLGQGKGCYDRLLARIPATVPRIGVGFDEQMVRQLPREPHDRPVDSTLTPSRHWRRVSACWETRSPAETVALGRMLAPSLAARQAVVGLIGDLGAGKTHLVRGIAEGLGVSLPVDSPSYTLSARYGGILAHIDLYRLDANRLDTGDAFVLDEELADVSCAVIEWADRAFDILPLHMDVVRIERVGTDRRRIEHVCYSDG